MESAISDLILMLENDLRESQVFDDFPERAGYLKGTVTVALWRLYAAQRAAQSDSALNAA